ncbi:hypothetical protein Trydic_g2859 [Trypoxylus dichotomus]
MSNRQGNSIKARPPPGGIPQLSPKHDPSISAGRQEERDRSPFPIGSHSVYPFHSHTWYVVAGRREDVSSRIRHRWDRATSKVLLLLARGSGRSCSPRRPEINPSPGSSHLIVATVIVWNF